MPDKKKVIRAVNVEPEIWDAAMAKANASGTSLSLVIRNALKTYVGGVAE